MPRKFIVTEWKDAPGRTQEMIWFSHVTEKQVRKIMKAGKPKKRRRAK